MLATGSAIRGLPVVTISGGEDVAEVRDLIYDPQAGRVVGLTLNKRGFLAGRSREVLAAEQIHAIGQDAVMVQDEGSLILPHDAPADVGEPPSGRDVTGDEVLTEQGTTSGGTGYIPLPTQLAVSGSTLIVPEATKDFIEKDLVGLGAAVDDFHSRLSAS
jgi:sporulation protein YlmC with PRC-barrel domain